MTTGNPDQKPGNENGEVTARYDDHVVPVWKWLNVPAKRPSDFTVEDYEGNEYLDVSSGISVTNVGHNNEVVVETAKSQVDEFVHGCSYVHPIGWSIGCDKILLC
ncbi:hypothetical protein DP106_14340 [Halonotius pteroides]|uniref:Aspartate aminotransferase family protein n=1 Tax=Halonotius pteroides TaxID=268735 RepID=A0A3A6PW46_9EURY|nr:hypothetical protein DP106_14340 [Halonotius pteroides]